MPLLRAGFAVATILFGAGAAFLGAVLILSALKTGSIQYVYGTGAEKISETVTRAGDAARYWRLLGLLGVVPAVLGTLAAWWGWRAIRR